MKRVINLLTICFLISFNSYAQEYVNDYGMKHPGIKFNPKHYICYKATSSLMVDGNLNEPSWENAEWTDYFQDIEGNKKPVPRFKTRAKMLWDDNFLYIAAELEEPHIWGTLTERDCVIYHDNDFEVFIDPDGDTHGYYEFEMNALNTVWDLLLLRPYRDHTAVLDHFNFNGLKTAVNIHGSINNSKDEDKKWTVEIAFPLDAFEINSGKKPADGVQWRINFSRVEWQHELVDGKYQRKINPETQKRFREDNWVWSPQGKIAMHMPEMWGFLQFSEKEVGTGKDVFQFNGEEMIKWELRNIYYAQREYHKENKHYAAGLKELEQVGLNLKRLKYAPKLYVTPTEYEVTALNKKNGVVWHINRLGKTWKTGDKKKK
ncbi:carbohydrate-binding family 9-like protein [Prolixibacteraceae bacterium JC049]|nr:carbohydrate-binding family 9-like protein [Prolixibacteraceae bacterium JC049]